MYDLIIIGGGPGGIAAGIYAARKRMHTALITDTFGGQSVVSADIQNWIGLPSVSGFDFSVLLEKHLRAQGGIDIVDGERAEKIEKKEDGTFLVSTKGGKAFDAKALLITTGSRHRRLGVPGEKEFEGRGVVYCATCDAPLFKGKRVAVVGGGNAGLEAAVDLLQYAEHIYLLHRNAELKGDRATQEKIAGNPKVEIILNASIESVKGENGEVSGLVYKDGVSGGVRELSVGGVFVEIGVEPNSDILKGLADLSEHNAIVTDPKTQRTSCPGIWAAGDVTDGLYRQNNISAGDSIRAVLNIYDALHLK